MKKRSNLIDPNPQVGMGVTRQVGSDSYPATIIEIYHNGTRIAIQEDIAIRTDQNGISESQTYTYQADPTGSIYHASLRKDGRWKVIGSKMPVFLGIRSKYYDFSF